MKAKVCNSLRSSEFGINMDNNSIRLHKATRFDENEMQDCFMKLKELVPTIPVDKKLSKVQLLQHVIDYIMDLEITLDVQSPMLQCQSQSTTTATTTTYERKPLTENNYFNTMVSDTYDSSVEFS